MDSAYHANPQRKSSLKEISPEDLRMLTSKHGGRPHCTYLNCADPPRWEALSVEPTTTDSLQEQYFFCDRHGRQFSEERGIQFPEG
jgi:hypothetical protein